jgi:hypothetical protein
MIPDALPAQAPETQEDAAEEDLVDMTDGMPAIPDVSPPLSGSSTPDETAVPSVPVAFNDSPSMDATPAHDTANDD